MNIGDVLALQADKYSEVWFKVIVLRVTSAMIRRGTVDAPRPGLYGFHGMWYGDDPMDVRSYGKIDFGIVRGVPMGKLKQGERL